MTQHNFKHNLEKISTIILDFDGVLTNGVVYLLPPHEFIRTMNVRDSYAIQHAVKSGLNVAIITGGNNTVVKERMMYLGVKDVFLQASNKMEVYENYKSNKGLNDEEVMYMGDDLPDYHVMKKVGIAACPKDAASEILSISDYISPVKGGEGCVRDIIEQVLKIKGKWLTEASYIW